MKDCSKPSLVLRCSADERVGLGHLRRCLALADSASARGWAARLVLDEGAEAAASLVTRRGHDAFFAGRRELVGAFSADILAIDIAHAPWAGVGFRSHLEEASRAFAVSCLIDGLPPYSFAADCDGVVDVLIVPYLGVRPETCSHTRVLFGPAWAVFDTCYAEAATTRLIRAEADRVLITMGGADPTGLSMKALEGVRRIEQRLDVTLVIGPLFASPLIAAIERAAQRETWHRVRLVRFPETLASEMVGCDVALSATGLTKYELALTGTPCVLMSIDRRHAEMNELFARAGTSIDLGAADRIDPSKIASTLAALLDDVERRSAMSNAGRRLVDGKGAARLLDSLGEVRAGARTGV